MSLSSLLKVAVAGTLLWFACSSRTIGQTPAVASIQEQTDVVRVFTDLVQTDVMVFDKQGKFINGLRKDEFELRIDGKPMPVQFFEQVKAGSFSEESQIAAARGTTNLRSGASSSGSVPLDRGRTIFFYVDDLHLDLAGLTATRMLIQHFIEEEMGQNDQAAIASASGQVGFLQQLTDHKAVLRAALQRVKIRPYSVRDMERPPMTEYQALLIERYDRDITDYFVEEYIRMFPGTMRDSADSQIRGRARSLLQQASYITGNTLFGLEALIRASSALPGRKLVFFISNGFFLDRHNSDSTDKLQKITSAAARSGVVIYSMDARGLVASLVDASSDVPFDPSGRLDRASHGELLESQDALNALARDTGGRPVFNTNNFEPGLVRALKETSNYYLLAWKPEREGQKNGRFRRVEVSIPAKPELTVRVVRGFFDVEPSPTAKKPKNSPSVPPERTTEAKLREAVVAPYPNQVIPISLNLNYMNTPEKGGMLSGALQVPGEFLSFVSEGPKLTAVVDIAGSVYNDRGQQGFTFKDHLVVTATSTEAKENSNRDVTYNFPVYLAPGLYQVRVGARDEKSGKIGTAFGWVEIPNLGAGQLAMSSLLLGERIDQPLANASTNREPLSDGITLNVSHRFHRNGYLRFLVFMYNAARSTADSKPDVAIQVQVLRDGQPVITTALRKIETAGISDLDRLPYAAEIPLNALPSGRYLLQVTGVDRVVKKSASQQVRFEIN